MALGRLARSAHPRERGFSLVELMAVVTIVGILAVIGIMLTRKHVLAARVNDGRVGVMTIRAAEESFRSANGRYLQCTNPVSPKFYPTEAPDETTFHWMQGSHADYDKWKMLGITQTAPTRFGFAVYAGLPGDPLPTPLAGSPGAPSVPQDWYMINFMGDPAGDGETTTGTSVSWKTEIFFKNTQD